MISRLCTFLIGDQLFGVDAVHVHEVIRRLPLTRIPLAPPAVLGLGNLRGRIVTCIDLRGRLGLAPRAGERAVHMVLEGDDGLVSLEVDDVGDVVELDSAGAEPAPPTLRGPARDLVTGAHVLADRLLLVLDAARAIEPAAAP
jgi:purine-binding chemotaxis protein CheW